jgi:hypothetical protein
MKDPTSSYTCSNFLVPIAKFLSALRFRFVIRVYSGEVRKLRVAAS